MFCHAGGRGFESRRSRSISSRFCQVVPDERGQWYMKLVHGRRS